MKIERKLLFSGLVVSIITFLSIAVIGGLLGYAMIAIGGLVKAFGGSSIVFISYIVLFSLVVVIALVGAILSIVALKTCNLTADEFKKKRKIIYTIIGIVVANIIFICALILMSATSVDSNQSSSTAIQIITEILELIALVISFALIYSAVRKNNLKLSEQKVSENSFEKEIKTSDDSEVNKTE